MVMMMTAVTISLKPLYAVIEIPSDSSLADAVETLSKRMILSAPVRNVDAPEDASWIDRYLGIVEFAGIAMWLLHQVCKLTYVTY